MHLVGAYRIDGGTVSRAADIKPAARYDLNRELVLGRGAMP
jgi:hypothetical protein